MSKVTIVKPRHLDAKLPIKVLEDDLAFDVVATERIIRFPFSVEYRLGISLQPDCEDGEGTFLYARSNATKRHIFLANSVGLIDKGYTGEVSAVFFTQSLLAWLPWIRKEKDGWKFSWNRLYKVGERVAQIRPTFGPTRYEWGGISETKRGSGGYGSTGTK